MWSKLSGHNFAEPNMTQRIHILRIARESSALRTIAALAFSLLIVSSAFPRDCECCVRLSAESCPMNGPVNESVAPSGDCCSGPSEMTSDRACHETQAPASSSKNHDCNSCQLGHCDLISPVERNTSPAPNASLSKLRLKSKAAHFDGAVSICDNSNMILSQNQIQTTHSPPLPMAGIPLPQTGIGASLLIL